MVSRWEVGRDYGRFTKWKIVCPSSSSVVITAVSVGSRGAIPEYSPRIPCETQVCALAFFLSFCPTNVLQPDLFSYRRRFVVITAVSVGSCICG